MKKEENSIIMKGHTIPEEGFAYAPNFIANSFRRGGDELFELHAHSQFEIYIFHQGNAHYLIDSQIYMLEPGTIILLDGSELHKVKIRDEPDNYLRSTIHFSFEWLAPLINGAQAKFLLESFKKFRHRIFTISSQKKMLEITELIEKLEQLATGEPEDRKESEIQITLAYLLLQLFNASKEDIVFLHEEKSEKTQYAQQIAAFLQQNFHKKIKLKHLSKELNLSTSYMSHLFKEETGYTVMQYLMNYRLIQAKTILEVSYNSKTIKECAHECGFESDAHFNRFFKAHVGMSPDKFRKKISKER
ncbi:AraC family transcriptional regulator [Jeotgalibaca sp. MA1X17-3]|uniref:AraC family transcriptional regulator n=1 Tax=Jeotgalibaca sp. MA1X17-3 TaxID=2908211 RepID=UPI001F216446|nr:AraC family transcriptional regulator [Jeotgalibaca sp. MA1X17-3]UJF16176.1 AraC family transcriptional regulator [Jeotgalibaca sp. MA1X17-3]